MSRISSFILAASVCFLLQGAWAVPAQAEEGPVRIGVTISESAKSTVQKYQPLMDYLTAKLGRPVEVRPLKSYDVIAEQMKAGELEAGILGSIAASKVLHRGESVPVARPEKGGVSSYGGYFIVRKDSGFKKIEQLKGKTFDSNAGSASVGHYFPRKALKDRKLDFESFFGKVTESPKHDTVVYKVLNREADCGTVKDTVFDKLAKGDARIGAELEVIAKSERFPDGNLLVARSAPAPFVKKFKAALLAMGGDPAAKAALEGLGADRFISASAKDFSAIAKAAIAMERK